LDAQRRCFRTENDAQALVPVPSAPAYRADTKTVDNAGRMAHAFYLLATQRIPDALGRPDEAYLALELLDAAADGRLSLPLAFQTQLSQPRGTITPIVRLVEVLYYLGAEGNMSPPNSSELLDKLIPDGDVAGSRTHATAMVMRVTKPVAVL
jgi:hypothetical protein